MIPLLENRRARKDYTIESQLEAGVVLSGPEVKSLRAKRGSLSESFVRILGHEAFLINARIEPYGNAAHISYDPTRSRKLLLHRRQITELTEKLQSKGMTAVPLIIGVSGNYIKLLIGIARGKKQHERKQELKERDLRREAERELRGKR